MPEKAPHTLERLWDDIPTGPVPIDHLLTSGRAARRRHRTVLAGAAGAFAVVLAASIMVVTQGPDAGSGHGEDLVAVTPPGTRLVGIGQVAVAVPSAWAAGAASCNTPFKDTAFFPWPQDCVLADTYAVSSVAITSGEFTETGTHMTDLEPVDQVGEHQVVADRVDCSIGHGESCRQVFGVPDLGAYFTVTVPEDGEGDAIDQIDTIRNSLTVLPTGQTTVPFVPPLGPASHAREQLEAAGFTVMVNQQTCPPTASCLGGVVGTTPEAGSVVEAGSTVAINVM